MKHIVFVEAKEAHVEHASPSGVIAIKVGDLGYYPTTDVRPEDAARFNNVLGVTPEIKEAAIAGSMFGWDCPAARPAMRWAAAREEKSRETSSHL